MTQNFKQKSNLYSHVKKQVFLLLNISVVIFAISNIERGTILGKGLVHKKARENKIGKESIKENDVFRLLKVIKKFAILTKKGKETS